VPVLFGVARLVRFARRDLQRRARRFAIADGEVCLAEPVVALAVAGFAIVSPEKRASKGSRALEKFRKRSVVRASPTELVLAFATTFP
jgi:hypothetical protein